jgi:pimeloyl-ACP methyl ester carboxylesterase
MINALRTLRRRFILRQMANFFEKVDRNPVTRTPDDASLRYEDVSLTSSDGVALKAWFIPSGDSDKIVIFNHFMLGNRAGAVPHKDWGNVAVDFMPLHKHLVEAGYSVFTYDLRNHGESAVYDGGKLGLTNTEYQDVLGAVRYVKEHYPNQKYYLYSQCYGTVSTMRAMDKSPSDFDHIRGYVSIQPLTPDGFVGGVSAHLNISHDENLDVFGRQLEKKTGYSVSDAQSPAEAVTMPTLLVQVHDDWRTTAASIEGIHERLATDDKELLWIEDETERLEGYNHFARNPKKLIDWLDSH